MTFSTAKYTIIQQPEAPERSQAVGAWEGRAGGHQPQLVSTADWGWQVAPEDGQLT